MPRDTGPSRQQHEGGRRSSSGNFRFDDYSRAPSGRNSSGRARRDHVDVDDFLGSLASGPASDAPDLTSPILSRVAQARPFTGHRDRTFANIVRVAFGTALCAATLGFGLWLNRGGLDIVSPPKAPVIATASEAAIEGLRNSFGGAQADAAHSVAPGPPERLIALTRAAITGFMRTTMPAGAAGGAGDQSASTLTSVFLAAAPDAPAASKSAKSQPATFASAAIRWTQSVFPVTADPVNEADLESQLERELLGLDSPGATSGTAGVFNPR